MLELIIPLMLLCVSALSIAWLMRAPRQLPMTRAGPAGYVRLEHEIGTELNGGHLPPDFGPPPPAATMEQDTNRIHVDD